MQPACSGHLLCKVCEGAQRWVMKTRETRELLTARLASALPVEMGRTHQRDLEGRLPGHVLSGRRRRAEGRRHVRHERRVTRLPQHAAARQVTQS